MDSCRCMCFFMLTKLITKGAGMKFTHNSKIPPTNYRKEKVWYSYIFPQCMSVYVSRFPIQCVCASQESPKLMWII